MPNVQDLVKLATEQIGYLEKSRDNYELYGSDCLYPKTKYAGADNYTLFSYELRKAGCGHPNGQPWCMTFLCWCMWKLWGKDLANKLLCGMLSSASTMDTKNAMVKAGRQVPLNKAQAGDIVFRSRSGGGHVGLVVGRSDNGKIISVEGNTSATDATAWNGGCVAKHVGGSWEWCVRPDWSLLPKEPSVWRWIHCGGKWYYQDQYGNNWHGWAKIKESAGQYWHKYYFAQNGEMMTGDQWIDDKYRLFMRTGTLEGALCISDSEGEQKVLNLTE